MREIDKKKHEAVKKFLLEGCTAQCKLERQGAKCCTLFSEEYYLSKRALCSELSKENLDMAIMGFLEGSLDTSDSLEKSVSHCNPKERESKITILLSWPKGK